MWFILVKGVGRSQARQGCPSLPFETILYVLQGGNVTGKCMPPMVQLLIMSGQVVLFSLVQFSIDLFHPGS